MFQLKKYLARAAPFLWSLLCVVLIAPLSYLADYLPDRDAYAHIKIAQLIMQQGWQWTLPWMDHSIMAVRYVDYHILYQLLHIPFLLVMSPEDAVKAANMAAMLFASTSLLALIRAQGGRRLWFWAILFFFASPIFTGRMLFARGWPLFLGLMFLFIGFVHKRRAIPAFVTALISVYTYPGFPILVAFAGIYAVACAVQKDFTAIKPAAMGILGIAAGVMFHPAFPYQFAGYWYEIGGRFFHPAGLEKTAEWQIPATEVALVGMGVCLSLLAAALLVGTNRTTLGISLLLLSLALIAALFSSVRAIEYLHPVLVLTLAIQNWRLPPRWQFASAAAIALGVLLWGGSQTYMRTRPFVEQMNPAEAFDAARYLEKHTPRDSVVMLSWDEFPYFFYTNVHNRYLNGLNPIYSFARDPERHGLVRSFFEGNAVNAHLIPHALGIEYAVLKIYPSHKTIIETLFRTVRENPTPTRRVEELYRNQGYVIFRFPKIPAK